MTEEQKYQLDILKKLDEVCKKNGLVYYLACGTCLGAIRHKGFIPWDHDIDVYMYVDDTKKLIECQKDFGDRYFVSTKETDDTLKKIKLEIRDNLIKCRYRKGSVDLGISNICIDIYPLYNCPDSQLGLTTNVIRSHILKMLVGGAPENHGSLYKAIANTILKFYKEENKEANIKKLEKKLTYKPQANRVSIYYGAEVSLLNAITFDKDIFKKPSLVEFEGGLYYGPTDPDAYLRKRYGDDYMTPPPQNEIDNELHLEIIKEEVYAGEQ